MPLHRDETNKEDGHTS